MQNKYYPQLFKKGKIGNVVIKNRIVRNSMGNISGKSGWYGNRPPIKAYAEAAEGAQD